MTRLGLPLAAVWAASLAAVIMVALPGGTARANTAGCSNDGAGNYTCLETSWNCDGPVEVNSVYVAIRNADSDGVRLRSGCTGHIGTITVDQWHGDAVKVGNGAHDLTVDTLNIHCYAHDAGKHQDGVQVMGGRNIRFLSGYVGCYSANDSQTMIHTGAAGNETPTGIVFQGIVADPAGLRDPNGQPEHTYGRGGAYGLSNGDSIDSGYVDSTLITDANRHDCYTGNAAVGAIWANVTRPDGTACP